MTDFASRLRLLRRRMSRLGIDAFLVPSADAFQSEYVPPSDRRLAWISGFTGSMGQAVILKRRAALFVDGRYTLQAGKECDSARFEIVPTAETPLSAWLASNLKSGQKLGIDPWLVTVDGGAILKDAAAKAGARLVLLKSNPLDAVWADRPEAPASTVVAHPLSLAGEDSLSKRRRAAAHLAGDKADAVLLCAPDSVSWLLNIRGNDVPYAPLVRAMALLYKDGSADLFLDAKRMDVALDKGVRVLLPRALLPSLKTVKRVRIDPRQTPLRLEEALKSAGAAILKGADPCLDLKAIKNEAEIAGARAAHRRDGGAAARFLATLKAGIRESEAAERLDAFRAQEKLAQGPSFGTIAAYGANAAIVHYRARKGRDALLKPGGLFLLDSGGQYLDGTTDVTRTVFIGPGAPSLEMKRLFTLVLKGHIALASAVFPKGTTGSQLDALARQFLWQEGLDYDHGTGHGVGSYLSVHEGPQRIAKTGGTAALEAGMILSIEPGYYRKGAFGIRIENLALVVPVKRPKGAERDLLGFEMLTLIPIDKRLIASGLLSKTERDWLNAYHQRVRKALKGSLDDRAWDWLERRTAPI